VNILKAVGEVERDVQARAPVQALRAVAVQQPQVKRPVLHVFVHQVAVARRRVDAEPL